MRILFSVICRTLTDGDRTNSLIDLLRRRWTSGANPSLAKHARTACPPHGPRRLCEAFPSKPSSADRTKPECLECAIVIVAGRLHRGGCVRQAAGSWAVQGISLTAHGCKTHVWQCNITAPLSPRDRAVMIRTVLQATDPRPAGPKGSDCAHMAHSVNAASDHGTGRGPPGTRRNQSPGPPSRKCKGQAEEHPTVRAT